MTNTTNRRERGIAIVLALFLMSAMSVLAASLMFLSQTETYASMNYRIMSQARYAGEAGVQKASSYLLDSTQYALPGSLTDPLPNYTTTVSPVQYAGHDVVLSWDPAQSNYPVAAVKTAFASAAQGTLAAGSATLSYKATAKLMMMQTFISYGGGPAVLQTWEITSDGSFTGTRTATVEVSAVVETPKVPANSYAAFATANTCGAIYFHGNVTVNSYDSSQGPPTGAGNSTLASGGDVGTNGNLEIQGSVAVEGNLSTPQTGVGTCTEGAVNALSETGSADVSGSMLQLPVAISYPAVTFSSTPPTNQVTIDSGATLAAGCTSLGLTAGVNCSIDIPSHTITVNGTGSDLTLPSVTIGGGYKLVLVGHATPPQTININSLNGSGEVDISANLVADNNEAVVLKIAGKNPDGTEMAAPFDLSTMDWKQNSGAHAYDASATQIVYGGTATISMKGGNSQSAAAIYAPNADFQLQGTQDLFGSVLAKTITNGGNASIHYDRRLQRDFWVAGHPMASTFNWKRF